ncbi:MAG: prepilin-type N-terminal cleavage/methylation domain-containing protein [bacterium]|nr:prepilin-type N-terminal cleavage/methylation domain-containing protein [bacterium]
MHQKGLTLVEVVFVLAIAVVLFVSTTAYAVPLIAREGAKSGTYQLESMVMVTKLEAVKRDRECYLVIMKAARTIQVRDTMGTSTRTDDQVLHEVRLPSSVAFETPDGSDDIDLLRLGPAFRQIYYMTFSPYGAISSGGGHVGLTGGGRYLKLSLFKAGGTLVEHWNGHAWEKGA